MNKLVFIFTISILMSINSFSQETEKKFWVSGAARGVMYLDELTNVDQDTITPKKMNSGHTLVDLSANLRPNSETYIKSTVRIRNEYGGFWGSGISFDLRELYVKGLIKKAIRYQIGDLNYKLTPFTFYNNDEGFSQNTPDIFKLYHEMLHYDMFYNDEFTWRQQGAATDFALSFKKYIEEMKFNLFVLRMNPTDFVNTSERIFTGGNVSLMQNKLLTVGFNYVNMLDIEGTSADTTHYSNPVISASYNFKTSFGDWSIMLNGETGKSTTEITNDINAPELSDYFNHVNIATQYEPYNVKLKIAYRNVGPKFRSPAAQTKRVNYNINPNAYSRYTGDQVIRPFGLWDLYGDPSMYNMKLSTGLNSYDPRYDNISPYGLATPNRTGLDITILQEDSKKRYNVEVSYQTLSEIAGQGTDELRKFAALNLSTSIYVNQFVSSFDRNAIIEFSYFNGNTSRESQEDYEAIDFNNSRITAGATFEIVKDIELLFGYELHTAKGSELIPFRNNYNEIIDFDELSSNLSEKMLGFGLRYNFNPKNSFQVIWQNYSWDDKELIEPKYGMQRLALIFNMKF